MRLALIFLLILVLISAVYWTLFNRSPASIEKNLPASQTGTPTPAVQTRHAPITRMPGVNPTRTLPLPHHESPASGDEGAIQRARPVYREEAPAFIQPQPVLEPPEPTQTHAVPQSMIDEQNRQNDFQPQPVPETEHP